ncbi:ABC transporter permease [Marinomonas sp. A79]|uniref:ABC transporter permease n=1 Tax=Marinomonas vulgaris TaxID=2823372 RepID=A0ABS5HDT4_9GAMM|nr:ABC transporter permease [Marinomonas vulgaris]MBR7889667.1 ABC transporter permease [Marinomonas vulgaris]
MSLLLSSRKWKDLSLLFPICLFLGIFFLIPLVILLIKSVTVPSFGLGNFYELLATSTYIKILGNTFLVATLVTVFAVLLGFPLAWCITLFPKGWGRFLLNVVLLSMWTSLLARTYSWLVLLQSSGVLNKILMGIGLIDQPLELVHNLSGVIIGMTYIMIPFVVLPLQASMSTIDPMVLQAASICGASARSVFFKIFIPLCKPGIFSGALMVFVMSLGYYVTPALLGGVSNMMLPEFIVQQIQNFLNWGVASASASILIAVTLVIFYIYLKVQSDSPTSSNKGS